MLPNHLVQRAILPAAVSARARRSRSTVTVIVAVAGIGPVDAATPVTTNAHATNASTARIIAGILVLMTLTAVFTTKSTKDGVLPGFVPTLEYPTNPKASFRRRWEDGVAVMKNDGVGVQIIIGLRSRERKQTN